MRELYKELSKSNKVDYYGLKSPDANTRAIIEAYSSDSDKYNPKNEDLFYSVFGKGQGYWGLRGEILYDEQIFQENINNIECIEGGKNNLNLSRIHRNLNFINKIKDYYKKENKRLQCQICNFDFEEKYGDLGRDFIEAHHIKPLCEHDKPATTRKEDIILVCSNCHRMLHKKTPCLLPDDLRQIIHKNL